MSDIPLGICREILLRLPAESLIRLRAVCKGWQAVIDDPCFVRAHAKKQLLSNTLLLRHSTGPPRYPLYYFNLEALNFTNGPQTIPVTPLKLTRSGLSSLPALPVAACNGLLLISPLDHEKYHRKNINWDGEGTWEIWNPLTHERLKLPQPDISSHVFGYGFGYDCASDDYRVVVIDYLYSNEEYRCRTNVYSLKADSWRKIGDCPVEFMNVHGAFLNSALHWIAWKKIIAFDLETEKYRQLKLPFLMEMRPKSVQLDALGGCLFLSCFDGCDLNGWVMNDYGAGDSWVKLFSFNKYNVSYLDHYYCYVRPVAYMKNKKQVVLQHDYGLLWFDVESNSTKTVSVHGLSVGFGIHAQNCVGSLFRLHDSCGRVADKRRKSKGKKEMKMADSRLTFCVRDYDANDRSLYPSHDSCYSSDSGGCNSSGEGGD